MVDIEQERREGMYASDLRYVQSKFKKVEGVLIEVNERSSEVAEDILDIKEAQISMDEVMRRMGAVVNGLCDSTIGRVKVRCRAQRTEEGVSG